MSGGNIEIFIPDYRNPSFKEIIIKGWSGKGVQIGKSDLNKLKQDYTNKSGVYLLMKRVLGDENIDDNYLWKVYIGKTNEISKRLINHKNKEWWTKAIFFVYEGDSYLNEEHIKYLEGRLFEDLSKVDYVKLENTVKPNYNEDFGKREPWIEEFVGKILLILHAIGFPFLDGIGTNKNKITKMRNDKLFYCTSSGANASLLKREDEYILLKNSILSGGIEKREDILKMNIGEKAKKIRISIMEKRYKQIEAGNLAEKNGKLIIVGNIHFTSPSTASDFVSGRSSNGRREWKDRDGKEMGYDN